MNKQQTIRVAKQVLETNVRFARELDSAFKDGVRRLDARKQLIREQLQQRKLPMPLATLVLGYLLK